MKRRGWRGVMRSLASEGPVLVTNHAEPEAVIVPAAEYARLLDIEQQASSRAESELETLRHRFDERLALLRTPEAGRRLRDVMAGPAKLRGKVKAGTGY